MNKLILLSVFICVIQYAKADNLPIFTAVASKTILPNSTYNITISIDKASESDSSETSFTATLSSVYDGKEISTSDKIQVKSGKSANLEFPVQQLSHSEYTLSLRASNSNSGSVFEDYVRVFVRKPLQAFLLQTDRPMYKPGEIVRFRVLGLDKNFKPLKEKNAIQIIITDSQQNLIKVWQDVNLQNGLYSSEFKLSTEPNMGNWKIEVQNITGECYTSTLFAVAEYVLPKFKMELIIPKSLRANDSKLSVKIKATYLFGKVVEGNCTVNIMDPYKEIFTSTVVTHVAISGSVIVNFEIPQNLQHSQVPLYVKATCLDGGTGWKQEVTKSTLYGGEKYVINFLDKGKRIIQGIPFRLRFRVTTADGAPVHDASSQAFKLTMTGSNIDFNSTISSNGIAEFKINTTLEIIANYLTITGIYKNVSLNSYIHSKSKSGSAVPMTLDLLTEAPSIGDAVEFNIGATAEMESFNYLLYGNDEILLTRRINLATPTKNYKLQFHLPTSYSVPNMRLIVYSTFKTINNVVEACFLEFPVINFLTNTLEIKVNPQIVEPGQNVTISVKTEPGSLVALAGIDANIETQGSQDSLQKVLMHMEAVRDGNMYDGTRLFGGSQTFQIFEQVGIVILTNGNFVKARWDLPTKSTATTALPRTSSRIQKLQSRNLNPKQKHLTPFRDSSDNDVQIRKHFQELWLWEEPWVSDMSGLLEINKSLPDSLTSWNISGFSLSPTKGLGIFMSQQTVTTFRPFFITLNLPSMIIFGEVIPLEVLVHNYEDKAIIANIALENLDNIFELQDSKNQTEMTKISVGPSKVGIVKFLLIPKQFGNLTIKVTAKSSNSRDAMQKSLIVKPPGLKKFLTKTTFINHGTKKTESYNFRANLPNNRAKGATSVQLTLGGNIIAPVVKNLNHLINMPTGCGEQNLLKFVTGIVTLKYLTQKSILTQEIKEQIIDILEAAYQRQLTFLHSDGSTSAFGRKADGRGSTWLTAYAIKSLIQAKPFITVDDKVISQGLKFLAGKQLQNGKFEENGVVIRIDSTDEDINAKVLTAYTLLTFLEASKDVQKTYKDHIRKGLNFIAAESNLNHTFTLSLVTYTLHLANHTKKDEFFKLAEKKIEEELTISHEYSVETISYALLTYLARGQIEQSLPLVKWLMKRRNSHGGILATTQGTVVGLTALAKYAQLTNSGGETDISINLTGSNTRKIQVNEKNSMHLQEIMLPSDSQEISLHVKGKGTAWAQVTWIYYTKVDEIKNPEFLINVQTSFHTSFISQSEKISKLRMTICTSFHPAGADTKISSNMAIVEVNLPSGYEFSSQDLSTLRQTPEIKRHELDEDGSKLITYFESFNENQVCFEAVGTKVFEINMQAQGYIEAYDYYQPTMRGRKYFETNSSK